MITEWNITPNSRMRKAAICWRNDSEDWGLAFFVFLCFWCLGQGVVGERREKRGRGGGLDLRSRAAWVLGSSAGLERSSSSKLGRKNQRVAMEKLMIVANCKGRGVALQWSAGLR